MSLLDGGPDVIEWYAEESSTDSYGTPLRKPSATPTERFTAQVQRATGEEAAELGQSTTEVYTFQTSRDLVGADSGLTVNGEACEVLRPPMRQGRSVRTASTKVWFHYVTPRGML